MKREPTPRFFFRHLRDGKSLRAHPLSWLAVGATAGSLPEPLLVRALHDRLRALVGQICVAPSLASHATRAYRLQQIFERHILGGEHWSLVSTELYISRRQFFRERRFLCDELCALLQLGQRGTVAAEAGRPSRADLLFNEAFLAFEAGKTNAAERILSDLCTWLPPGDLHSKALVLTAECALDRLRLDTAATVCMRASDVARTLADPDSQAIALARVNVAWSRYYLLLSNYHHAHSEIEAAISGLSRMSSSDARHSEVMKGLLVRAAEIAINLGDYECALENVRRLKYATGSNEINPDVVLDLASVESATETIAGHFQNALSLLEDAFARAEHQRLNRQVVKLFIERAWVESQIDADHRHQQALAVDELAEALHLPWLTLEAALFSAVNETGAPAMVYASRARSASPPRSMSMARATHAQAVASFALGRIADAWDLAGEVERLSEHLDNNRLRAAALALMARIRLRTQDGRTAFGLKRSAEELLRRYGTAAERETFAQWTAST